MQLGELDEAETLLLESYKNIANQKSKIPARARIRLDQARKRLYDFYQARNMPDEARKYRPVD